MAFPKQVRVGAYRYSLSFSDEMDTDRVGQTTASRQQILLARNQAPDYLADTVLHELLHAMWATTNLRSMKAVGSEEEEAIIQALTPLLLDMLRRNPKLVTYLLEQS